MFCLLRCIVQFKRCVDYKLKFLVDNKTRIPLPRLDDTRTDVTAIFIDQTSPGCNNCLKAVSVHQMRKAGVVQRKLDF